MISELIKKDILNESKDKVPNRNQFNQHKANIIITKLK